MTFFVSVKFSLDDNSKKNTVVENNSAFFDLTVVTNLVLTNTVLVICNQVHLAIAIWIDRDDTNERIASAINSYDDLFISSIEYG